MSNIVFRKKDESVAMSVSNPAYNSVTIDK